MEDPSRYIPQNRYELLENYEFKGSHDLEANGKKERAQLYRHREDDVYIFRRCTAPFVFSTPCSREEVEDLLINSDFPE